MDKVYAYFLKAGLIKSIVIVTLVSVILSLIFTYLSVILIFGRVQPDMPNYLLVAALVPLVVAPLASSTLLKLLFKIDALEKETKYLATYDALTGLFTRRAFYEHAEKQLKLARRESKHFSVLVADLDGFKGINDTFGHHAGDMALKFVSSVIRNTIRDSDIAGRVGGDEFIFCLPNAEYEEGLKFGQRLVDNVDISKFMYESKTIKLSMSIGLYSSDSIKADEIDLMIKEADQALYRAKKQGKNRVAV